MGETAVLPAGTSAGCPTFRDFRNVGFHSPIPVGLFAEVFHPGWRPKGGREPGAPMPLTPAAVSPTAFGEDVQVVEAGTDQPGAPPFAIFERARPELVEGWDSSTLEAGVFDFPRILRAFALLRFGPLAETSWVGLPLRRA